MEKLYDILDKVSEKIRYVIVFGVCALIVSLYVFLVRFPAQDRLAKLQREVKEVQATYQSKKAIADDLQNWQLEVQRLQVLLTEALNQLPEVIDTDQLLISVPNIAKKNALEVREFSVSAERPKGTYAEVPMVLKMTGTFRGIGGFAQEIGDQPRIMAVKNLELKKTQAVGARAGGTVKKGGSGDTSKQSDGESPDDGVPLDINAEVLTYRFMAQPAAAAKAPAPAAANQKKK